MASRIAAILLIILGLVAVAAQPLQAANAIDKLMMPGELSQAHVKQDAVIAGAREIAFFPPMTGG